MKKRLSLIILWACLQQPSWAAEGIDQVYETESTTTWGERLFSAFQRPNFNKSYAVVIGVSSFRDFSTLSNPEDPERIKNYLLDEAGFDYVHLLTEDKVTPERVRQIMVDELRTKIGEQDRLLFYWAGHGATLKNGERSFGYLPTARSGHDEYSTMLDMEDLAKWDKRLNAKQTLYLLDACFSGGAAVIPQSDNQARTLKQIARPSRQIITAGLADQETFVLPELGSSVFTNAVLDGLRGRADLAIDGVKDGVISARELELFIKKRVDDVRTEVEWKHPITPQLSRLPNSEEGDFFFFSPKTVAAAKEQEDEPTSRQPAETQAMSEAKTKTERLPFEPEMVPIPAGSFTMGCVAGRDDVQGRCAENEKPPHTVSLPAFQLGKYEVTFDEWDACERAKACPHAEDMGWGRGRRPVINVSWNDITQKYIPWLNQQTGKRYRLPTEAEWEYAARAGEESDYPWGEKINCAQARYGSFSDECKDSDKTVVMHQKS